MPPTQKRGEQDAAFWQISSKCWGDVGADGSEAVLFCTLIFDTKASAKGNVISP